MQVATHGRARGTLPCGLLEYELIEDSFDDTTHIRSTTEQAVIDGKGWLIRTTMYSPHQLAIDVTFVAGSDAKEGLFDAIRL